MDADEKLYWNMVALTQDMTTPAYNYEMTELFTQDMSVSMTTRNDEILDRNKMNHQRGVVVPIVYESVGDHGYTGLYESGSQNGILRLSESAFLIDGKDSSNPSAAIKFLIDGSYSRNHVFLVDWNDQESLNPLPVDEDGNFKAFTTIPPAPPADADCFRQTALRKISEGAGNALFAGASDCALIEENGTEVADADAQFPFEF